jgi:hypothetical protein
MKDFLNLKPGEVGIECRFATYVKSPQPELPDLHLVKEQVHKDDGTIVPVVKAVYNYERPYWVVKKGYRNFNQPKEWIEKERVNEFYSTQTDLLYKAASSLGKPYFKKSIKDLAAESPYLFGINIISRLVIDYRTNIDFII